MTLKEVWGKRAKRTGFGKYVLVDEHLVLSAAAAVAEDWEEEQEEKLLTATAITAAVREVTAHTPPAHEDWEKRVLQALGFTL